MIKNLVLPHKNHKDYGFFFLFYIIHLYHFSSLSQFSSRSIICLWTNALSLQKIWKIWHPKFQNPN